MPPEFTPNTPAEWLSRHVNLNWQDIHDLARQFGLELQKSRDGQNAPAIAFTWPGLDAQKVRIYPKDFLWEGTARPILWPALSLIRETFPDSDGLVIVEGEFDALVLLYLGIPAVSVTGGTNTSLYGLGRELAQIGFKRALIIADSDRPGLEAGQKWAKALREDGLAVRVETVVSLGLGRASMGEKDVRDAWLSRTDLDEAAFVGPIIQALDSIERGEGEAERGQNVLEVGLLRAEDLIGHESGPQWLVNPLLPDGAGVLLSAKYDSLKTWAALYLARQVLEATDRTVFYMDFDVMPPAVVRERLRATGLDRYIGDRLHFHTGPDMTALTAMERWGEFVNALLSLPPGLIVIDSLKTWLLNVKLNSDTDVLPYLQSLLRLRSAGWTILVVHHVPKIGDSDFKNTGSIGDAVDVIWKGQRAGNVLKLEAKKRRTEVPATVGLDMSDPARPVLLDGDIAERKAKEARILDFVRQNPRVTVDEISEGTGIPVGTLKKILPEMVSAGVLAVEGTGRRGDPLRYSLPLPPDDEPPPPDFSTTTSDMGQKSSSEAVNRNYHGQESRSDGKNPESEIRFSGKTIGNGGEPNPEPGENDVVEPTSGSPNFGSPHRTYISEGSPGDGPDGRDPDPSGSTGSDPGPPGGLTSTPPPGMSGVFTQTCPLNATHRLRVEVTQGKLRWAVCEGGCPPPLVWAALGIPFPE
jgi:hypothetical protein